MSNAVDRLQRFLAQSHLTLLLPKQLSVAARRSIVKSPSLIKVGNLFLKFIKSRKSKIFFIFIFVFMVTWRKLFVFSRAKSHLVHYFMNECLK